jgi:hypothetical protein
LEITMLTQLQTAYLNACSECAAACLQCATLCLKEDDPKPMVGCILLDLECADMCRHNAQAIARGDSHLHAISLLCAEVCEKCAAECGKHTMHHCQSCAESCKRCAVACRSMVQ